MTDRPRRWTMSGQEDLDARISGLFGNDRLLQASELFVRMVGRKALLTDVLTRTIYDTLYRYELHHRTSHADCEERGRQDYQIAVEALRATR